MANEYSGKVIFLIFLALMVFPSDLFAKTYQSNFANGIYALEYHQESGECQYDTNDSGILVGTCTLFLVNHSNRPVTFHLSLHQKFVSGGWNVLDIINRKDHRLELDAKEHRAFEIKFSHSLESSMYQDLGGQINLFNVTVTDDDGNTRQL
ncbi:hypothetical protein MUN88_00875 [Gracilibacillus caseinilyticus]|uniref:Secreted protein n=1 Tax=Gracilibacillus caseinilyticus TaxID=2932256 RepID=A0ABY4EXZ2_9BACI|nr:hypothetical protein [Gracilibacillus caseinilyticus]UOQ48747.1 hypothetical protein MUN88_00875 [Gracilibacillus caseinilyticus]